MREIKFYEAIREATAQCLKRDESVYIMGLGVPDPKGIFGTTVNLQEEFGKDRVFDMPIIENAATGIAIGTALVGMRPIITHQRVEFALLSMEQIVNQAAKWYHMTAGQKNVPLVIRMIIGRGWGQGAQHCQSLESWFAHIPGLKVVMPSTPYDAKGLLASAVEDNNPVIFLEHRWLHNTYGNVPEDYYKVAIGKCNIIENGSDITIISHSYTTILAIKAARILSEHGVSAEIIDIRTIRPLDKETIIKSVKKTKRVLVVDNGWSSFGVSAEIIATLAENISSELISNPVRIGVEDVPVPSTRELAKYAYPNTTKIINTVFNIFNMQIEQSDFEDKNIMYDVPDQSFMGPF